MQHQLILQLLEEGKLKGVSSIPKRVTTFISNIFIFEQENIVLKIYKRDNEYWNTNFQDISSGDSRINFIQSDFNLNNKLNPNVYIDLKSLEVKDNQIILSDTATDELVIVMSVVDTTKSLSQTLLVNKLTIDQYEDLGRQFIKHKNILRGEEVIDLSNNWYDQLQDRFVNLRNWMYEGSPLFEKNLSDKACDYLEQYLKDNKSEFENITHKDLSVLIDCNSENLLYIDNKLQFIDTYAPKEEWRVGYFEHDIYRTASDIYGLVGKEEYKSFMKGVSETLDIPLSKHDFFYLLYGASIMAPYYYMLAKEDEKYLVFAEKYKKYFISLLQTIN